MGGFASLEPGQARHDEKGQGSDAHAKPTDLRPQAQDLTETCGKRDKPRQGEQQQAGRSVSALSRKSKRWGELQENDSSRQHLNQAVGSKCQDRQAVCSYCGVE